MEEYIRKLLEGEDAFTVSAKLHDNSGTFSGGVLAVDNNGVVLQTLNGVFMIGWQSADYFRVVVQD